MINSKTKINVPAEVTKIQIKNLLIMKRKRAICQPFYGSTKKELELPLFRYGNYKSYYNYRCKSDGHKLDDRILAECIPKLCIENKCVLDIGCNNGLLTLQLALMFLPKRICGLDIDITLVDDAWNNLEQYSLLSASIDVSSKSVRFGSPEIFQQIDTRIQAKLQKSREIEARTSLREIIQDLWQLGSSEDIPRQFPLNVYFAVSDFMKFTPNANLNCFDCITCFSVSKWVHLAHGDDGIKRFFHKIYSCLSETGSFILEYQPKRSYDLLKRSSKSAATLTEAMKTNLNQIAFYPGVEWLEFLIDKVGFKAYKLLHGTPFEEEQESAGGFSRSIYLFIK